MVKTLSERELSRFQELWAHKKAVPMSQKLEAYSFKLALDLGERHETWLYDPKGFVTVLTVKNRPMYELEDLRAFNALIGVSGT